MKKMILSGLIVLSSLNVFASRSAGEYQCMMDKLDMCNSSIYAGLDTQDLDKILSDSKNVLYSDVSNAAELCELKSLTERARCGAELEVEFAGIVKDASEITDGAFLPTRTSFRVGNFTHYQPHVGCGLPEKFAEKALLKATGIYKNGTDISGVLIYNADSNSYRINGLN